MGPESLNDVSDHLYAKTLSTGLTFRWQEQHIITNSSVRYRECGNMFGRCVQPLETYVWGGAVPTGLVIGARYSLVKVANGSGRSIWVCQT